MAIKTISQFDAATPASNDKILFEQNGEGKSATIGNAVNTCSLSYEEIMASTDLSGKIASASALKTTADKIQIYRFSLPNNMSSLSVGDNCNLFDSPYSYDSVVYLKFFAYLSDIYQFRDFDNFFNQVASLSDKKVVGVNLKTVFPAQYNGASAYAVVYVK